MKRGRSISALFYVATALGCVSTAHAQDRPSAPASAQEGAPVDLTGQWVALVTEDWRWRMVTPPKGDYASVPLTPAGKAAADEWDLATDNAAELQCKPYGVGGLSRIPGRIRISWQDANTLKLESDAGQQVRQFHFVDPAPNNELPALNATSVPIEEGSWQGYSRAQWLKLLQSRGLGFGASRGSGGALRAVTLGMYAGYLRKNGVPYSADAVVTEQYNVFEADNGDTWLFVTTIVDDPVNLTQPFITSSNYKKEADRSKWSPSPCHTDPPLEPPVLAPPEH